MVALATEDGGPESQQGKLLLCSFVSAFEIGR